MLMYTIGSDGCTIFLCNGCSNWGFGLFAFWDFCLFDFLEFCSNFADGKKRAHTVNPVVPSIQRYGKSKLASAIKNAHCRHQNFSLRSQNDLKTWWGTRVEFFFLYCFWKGSWQVPPEIGIFWRGLFYWVLGQHAHGGPAVPARRGNCLVKCTGAWAL